MFKIKIVPKALRSKDNWGVAIDLPPTRLQEVHTEVGFSHLQPGDVITLRSDGGTYRVDHKVLFEQGERIFIHLITNNPNQERGYDYIPRGDRYELLGASKLY